MRTRSGLGVFVYFIEKINTHYVIIFVNVITKTIGKGKYAYLVIREGEKVVHKYLGSADDPRVVNTTTPVS